MPLKRGLTKSQRAEKWDVEFISCNNHTTKRCSRAQYKYDGSKRCWICLEGARTDKGKAYQKHFNVRSVAKYKRSEKGKAVTKRYEQSEKGKATQSRYNHSDKGAIRYAWNIEKRLHG